ncbi:hypothetical protein [Pseudonocardia sp. N23]|uniref:hypothetical protein n=1 Tax=Pseudonocardia sp. N23 TaxID=1987376 RepID=UPI000BFEA839|nr:hypothetical protein [Pseudonocardia sp. N23]GAY12022.1 hypothetical protein TOK_0412 [Pseudonocardia sp. N23]
MTAPILPGEQVIVVEIGGGSDAVPVFVPGTAVGGASRLDDLLDVDAPAGSPGLLERQDDGRVHPVSRDDVLAPHIVAPEPHPAYDDLPDLRLIFENGLI